MLLLRQLTQEWSRAVRVLGKEGVIERFPSTELMSAQELARVEAYSVAVFIKRYTGD